jgi:hypothetical protein
MLNLLKKKKLNVLKTYNINVNHSYVVEDIRYMKESPEKREESKQTARFNHIYEPERKAEILTNIKTEESESFLSYDNKNVRNVDQSEDTIEIARYLNKGLVKEPENVYEKLYNEISREKKAEKPEENSKIKLTDNLCESKSGVAAHDFMNIDKSKFEYLDITKNERSIQKLHELTQPEIKVDHLNNIKAKPLDNQAYYDIDHQYNFDNNEKNIDSSLVKVDKSLSEENNKVISNINKLIDDEKSETQKLIEKPLFKDISYETKAKDETQDKINKIYSILDDSSKLDYDNSKSKNKYSDKVSKPDMIIPNTAEILNMALELKESKKTIEAMRGVIDDLRREIKLKEEQYKKDISDKTSLQKFEFENILQRQTGLVESLLAEKKQLSTIVEELKEQLNSIDKNNHKKVQAMMDNFDLETKKNKDAWFQAEKLRRKKWEETKIKEIKDMTVKGLEPEIERILTNHKQEVIKMEDRFNEDLRRQREKLNADYERRLGELKDRFIKEKDEALEHERGIAGQRIRNQNERLEDEYNEERRRWNSALQAEIQRLEILREKDKKVYEDQLAKIEERNKLLLDEKESYYKLKISELEKRFGDKIKFDNEEYKIKFDKEKEKFIEDKTKEFEAKTREMKQELLKDRDKQIQIILDKLGEETILERKKIQNECETKADSINKQLRQENEQMKHKIQELSDKVSAESKVRLMLDDGIEGLTRKLQEKERELAKKEKVNMELSNNLSDLNNRYSNITREFNKEKLEIESEYKLRSQKIEGDLKLVNEKLESTKSYYEGKVHELKGHHNNEILDIEDRIKKSLNRKEEMIKKLQEDIQLKDLTIQKYEDLLAKQRKELLMNN